jgi:hypothetical protein
MVSAQRSILQPLISYKENDSIVLYIVEKLLVGNLLEILYGIVGQRGLAMVYDFVKIHN